MRSAPIQSTRILDALMMNITVGNITAIRRPVRNAVAVRSSLASSKRASSSGSRTKARTTRMPVICSRRTLLTRSTRSCMSWNAGTILRITLPRINTAAGMLTTRTIDRPVSVRTAMMTPITIVSGAATIIVHAVTTMIWTCWTSFVIRVISDGAPK